MMKSSLCIWLKQHRMAIGGLLLPIAITAYNASFKSQPSSANTPQVAMLIASSPTLPPTSPTQSSSSPTPSLVSPTQSAAGIESLQQEAVQVISDYYSAIARRDYEQAYSAWEEDGVASQQSFEQFKQGFANTTSVTVEFGKPGRPDPGAGSIYIEIPVTVTAVTTNGTPQRFRGSYVLRRVNDVPGSTPEQRRWASPLGEYYSSQLACCKLQNAVFPRFQIKSSVAST